MIAAIMIIFILIIFYLPILWTWNHFVKKRLNLIISKILKTTHYLALLLTLVQFLLIGFTVFSFINLAIPRYATIVFFITGVFNYSICDKHVFGRFEQFYFRFFTYFPVTLVVLVLFPITSLFVIVGLSEKFNIGDIKTIYYDRHIKIEADFSFDESRESFNNINLQVYEKKLLLKKKLVDTNIMALDVSEIKVNYDSDSTRIIIYKIFDPNFSRTDTVTVAKIN